MKKEIKKVKKVKVKLEEMSEEIPISVIETSQETLLDILQPEIKTTITWNGKTITRTDISKDTDTDYWCSVNDGTTAHFPKKLFQ